MNESLIPYRQDYLFLFWKIKSSNFYHTRVNDPKFSLGNFQCKNYCSRVIWDFTAP